MSRFIRKSVINEVKKITFCTYCNKTNCNLEIDHIYPVILGGSGDIQNLTMACNLCNTSKGMFTISEWLLRIENKRQINFNKTISYIYRYKTKVKRNTLTIDESLWLSNKIQSGRINNTYYCSVINSLINGKYKIYGRK